MLTWNDVTRELPKSDKNVLIRLRDFYENDVFVGYFDSKFWQIKSNHLSIERSDGYQYIDKNFEDSDVKEWAYFD